MKQYEKESSHSLPITRTHTTLSDASLIALDSGGSAHERKRWGIWCFMCVGDYFLCSICSFPPSNYYYKAHQRFPLFNSSYNVYEQLNDPFATHSIRTPNWYISFNGLRGTKGVTLSIILYFTLFLFQTCLCRFQICWARRWSEFWIKVRLSGHFLISLCFVIFVELASSIISFVDFCFFSFLLGSNVWWEFVR